MVDELMGATVLVLVVDVSDRLTVMAEVVVLLSEPADPAGVFVGDEGNDNDPDVNVDDGLDDALVDDVSLPVAVVDEDDESLLAAVDEDEFLPVDDDELLPAAVADNEDESLLAVVDDDDDDDDVEDEDDADDLLADVLEGDDGLPEDELCDLEGVVW